MKQFRGRKAFVFIGILLLVVALPLALRFVWTHKEFVAKALVSEKATPGGPIISHNAPAFASSGYDPASNANDSSYDNAWRSQQLPVWLAYDLSRVPAVHRNRVLLVWYNESYNYDHTLIGYPTYNMPQDYTIEVNAAAGGGEPPTSGWVTKVVVKGNHYHSRQHVITMAGNNWIRIRVTATDGSDANYDAKINMDVYDASYGVGDDWIFLGDSITAGAMGHLTIGTMGTFAQLINAKLPDKFPVEESGGTSFLTSQDGAKHIGEWLALFPGKYVGLSYGTNDANGCRDPQAFYNDYVTMVQAVLKAGKFPLIPSIPWGRTSNIQQCGPGLNSKIAMLYKTFPGIIKGPDLWTFFHNQQRLISGDNIHPTDEGFAAYRQEWVNVALGVVYR